MSQCLTEGCEHAPMPSWDKCFCCVMAPIAVTCGNNRRHTPIPAHTHPRRDDIIANTLRLQRNTQRDPAGMRAES